MSLLNVRLSAHFQGPEAATLSILWWRKEDPPESMLEISTSYGTAQTADVSTGAWKQLAPYRNKDERGRVLAWSLEITELQRDREYTIRLLKADDTSELASCRFETLPAILQSVKAPESDRSRPFTVLLGSCYHSPSDPKRQVGRAYERLANIGVKPHIKFLTGDQVYVDQPPGKFGSVTTEFLRHEVADSYVDTWGKLGPMLSQGINHLTTDDHEFWNDYPNSPPVPWLDLWRKESTRRTMESICTEFVRDVQHARPMTTFTIGSQESPCLEFFILDTRVDRTKGTRGFAGTQNFDAMLEWLGNLQSPGVIILGAPIFVGPYSEFLNIDSDTNLPGFDTYPRFVDALVSCEHDVVVCGGDVHYGRLSTVHMPKHGDQPDTHLWEIIASPLTCLPSSTAVFDEPGGPMVSPTTGKEFGTPFYFPQPPGKQLLQALWETGVLTTGYKGEPRRKMAELENKHGWQRIRYLRAVPKKNSSTTKNHFMTLAFSAGQGLEVHLEVSAWLVNERTEPESGPAEAWRYHIVLDSGRDSPIHPPHCTVPVPALNLAIHRESAHQVQHPPQPVLLPYVPGSVTHTP